MSGIRQYTIFFIPRYQRAIHDSCSPSHHVTTKHWEKQHHAVTSLFCSSLAACWTAGNSDAVVWCYRPFPWNLWWAPWNFPWFYVGASNTTSQTFEHHVPCHSTTPWGNSTLHWGPFCWFAKSCPSGLVCVERTESKGISRGPSLSSSVDGQRRGQWWELHTYLRTSNFGHGLVAKP